MVGNEKGGEFGDVVVDSGIRVKIPTRKGGAWGTKKGKSVGRGGVSGRAGDGFLTAPHKPRVGFGMTRKNKGKSKSKATADPSARCARVRDDNRGEGERSWGS